MTSAQDEVRWVLETIRDNYPGDPFGTQLVRRDMDDMLTLDPEPRRERSVDLTERAVIAASHDGEAARTPEGTAPRFDVVTRVRVRVEAAHRGEHGLVPDKDAFLQIAKRTRAAIDAERVFPTVQPDADPVGRVTYYNALVSDLESNSREGRGYYRRDFTVELRGKTNPTQ